MTTSHRTFSVCILLLLLGSTAASAAGEHCSSTYLADWYVPSLGAYHKVAKLTDAAGEQTALFDLTWGGILVSLQYGSTEYIAAPATIAGSQTILHATNYTPTMGGDSSNRGSVVTGAACSTLNHLWLTAGMTDYNQNAAASTGYIYSNNQWYFDHFSAPYVVSTHAYFVPNPAGMPQYYLRLDRTISNIDGTDADAQENYSFLLDTLVAIPTTYQYYAASPNCTSGSTCANSTASVTAGYYNTVGQTTGVAIATFPSSFWSSQPGAVYFSTDSLTDRRVLHLNRTAWTVAPQTSQTYGMYIMVGSWANASLFAGHVCNFSVSDPTSNTYSSSTATGNITIGCGSSCAWKASSSNPAWLTVGSSSGTGSSTVTYTLQANTTGVVRMANLYVAGKILSIWQNP